MVQVVLVVRLGFLGRQLDLVLLLVLLGLHLQVVQVVHVFLVVQLVL